MTRTQLIEAVKEIHALTNAGKPIDAMKKWYSDDVVMIEDNGVETHGLEKNIEREIEFFNSITAMREMKIEDTFVYDNLVVTTSYMDLDIHNQTFKGKQVSVTHWENGKVVREQFIYHTM